MNKHHPLSLTEEEIQDENEADKTIDEVQRPSLVIDTSSPLANYSRLKEAVLDKRPVLREILKKRGTKNLYDYSQEYIRVNLNPPIQDRQEEFLGTFRSEVAKSLGAEVADSAVEQLRQHYYVSTADHHGPICHPFFLNSNLMASAPYFEYADPVLKNVIVLACANVSLNNSSFPRGLIFNSFGNGKIQTHRLSFLPSNAHSSTVYNFRPYTSDEVKKIKVLLQEKVRSGDVQDSVGKKINDLIDEIYNQPVVLDSDCFSDQVTKTNFQLWKKFFPSNDPATPNLIYLEQEGLVVRLLIEHHLYSDSTIARILFDPGYDDLMYKYFEGIMGAFSREREVGTYLFWGVSKDKNYRVQLWKDGDYLASKDGSIKIELSPTALEQALVDGQIIPSMMMIFITLCFYYGLKCLGGFNQVNYLTFMKNAYIKMQVDRGNYRSIEVCARAQTKELCGDLTVAFLGGPNGELIPATGLDLVLYSSHNTWPCLVEESKQISLEEALAPMMPEFYRIIYPEAERDPVLAAITPEEITKLIKLDEKIKPCITL